MIDLVPYRADKNLGKAYNDAFRMLPNESALCLRDYDTLWLTHDYNKHLDHYHSLFPNSVLTCYTNRISPLSRLQLYGSKLSDNNRIDVALKIAEKLRDQYLDPRVKTNRDHIASQIDADISGMVMVVPRRVWEDYPFNETGLCLGVDTDWNRRIRAAGVRILRMNGIYIWHTYRLLTGIHDKRHLK